MKTELKRQSPPKAPVSKYGKRYPSELKLKIVKMYLEEGYEASFLRTEFGLSQDSIKTWTRAYRKKGEEGLRPKERRSVRSGSPSPVRETILEEKRKTPWQGCKRISQILRRLFFMKASPETVRKTLHEEGLMEKTKAKREHNPSKPRFFERSTPNQMWQSDIMSFRLGGGSAYVIGYIDDYSRFITGIGLYRSQTAEHVIEVYRQARSDFGPPKEMLTDNGRQYKNWRGTTRFEQELVKDRIKHIRSSPHHPMTLGKIERFWKSLLTEFLFRVQFESFEDARTRLSLWVKYYNHKRPHQGIGGLCPADRYFEIQQEIRQAMEKGIQENILENALRGKPQKPFYMVGRLGSQAVALRAEKGKLRMLVDDEQSPEGVKEVVYDLNPEGENADENSPNKNREQRTQNEDREEKIPAHGRDQRDPKMRGGALPVEGDAKTRSDLPGTGRELGAPEPFAESGTGGNDPSLGAQEEPGERSEAEPEVGEAFGEEDAGSTDPDDENGTDGETIAEHPAPESEGNGEREPLTGEERDDRETNGHGTESQRTDGGDPESPGRPVDGQGRSEGSGPLPEELLSNREESSGRNDGSLASGTARETDDTPGPGEGSPSIRTGSQEQRTFDRPS